MNFTLINASRPKPCWWRNTCSKCARYSSDFLERKLLLLSKRPWWRKIREEYMSCVLGAACSSHAAGCYVLVFDGR